MVNKGWAHSDLNEMDEEEFLDLFDEQIALDEARAEAERKAMDRAGRN